MTSPAVQTGVVAFIEARLDANEKLAREAMGYGYNSGLRLLAYVTAHRAILALHAPREAYPRSGLQCGHCADQCHSGSGLHCDDPDARYPCQTVRLLAAIDADHPAFRPEWKPVAT